MSLIHCRTDRYIYCPFIYCKGKQIFLCTEREVIMIITISRETVNSEHTASQTLAEEFRYTFYDKEINAEGGEKNA